MISYSNQLLYHKQHLKEIKADLKFINSDSNKAIQNIIKQFKTSSSKSISSSTTKTNGKS